MLQGCFYLGEIRTRSYLKKKQRMNGQKYSEINILQKNQNPFQTTMTLSPQCKANHDMITTYLINKKQIMNYFSSLFETKIQFLLSLNISIIYSSYSKIDYIILKINKN